MSQPPQQPPVGGPTPSPTGWADAPSPSWAPAWTPPPSATAAQAFPPPAPTGGKGAGRPKVVLLAAAAVAGLLVGFVASGLLVVSLFTVAAEDVGQELIEDNIVSVSRQMIDKEATMPKKNGTLAQSNGDQMETEEEL